MPESSRKAFWKSFLKLLLKLGIAALLIAWVVGQDGRGLLESLRRMNPLWVVLCFCAQLTQMVLTGVRWKWLIADDLHVSWYEVMRLTFIGLFANMFIPAGAVGGDVVKAAMLAARVEKGRRVEATVSILVDRIVGVGGLFLLVLLFSGILFGKVMALPLAARSVALVLTGVSLAGCAVIVVLVFQDFIFRWRAAGRILQFADRWMRGIPGGIVRSVAAYRGRWRVLVGTTLLSGLVLHPLLMLAIFFPLYGGMHQLPPVEETMAAVAYGNVASALPVTPGGLGTRDAVIKTMLTAWNVPERAAVAAMVVYTATMLLTDLLGGLAFLLPPEEKRRKHQQLV